MIIGDDVQIYTVNGNQITVDDTDFDPLIELFYQNNHKKEA